MPTKREAFGILDKMTVDAFEDANALEARDGAQLAVKERPECVEAGIERLVELQSDGDEQAGKYLNDLVKTGLDLSESCLLDAMSKRDVRPVLSIDTIVRIAETDHADWLLRCVEAIKPDKIQPIDNPRRERRAFASVMLQKLRRVCQSDYGRGSHSDFVRGVGDLADRKYAQLAERVHDFGDISDEQLMRYGVALSPTTNVARTIEDLTGKIPSQFETEILEAFRRGHDGAIRYILDRMPDYKDLVGDHQFKQALRENPSLVRTEHAGASFYMDTIDETTARCIAEYLGTFECRRALSHAFNRYSYKTFTDFVDRYQGRTVTHFYPENHVTLPRVEYLVENLDITRVYSYFHDLLENNPDRADELWDRFIENRSREQILTMLAQAVEHRHETILKRAKDEFDLDVVPDDEVLTDETMAGRMPGRLGQLLLEKAIEDMLPSIDYMYPEYGQFRDIDDDWLDGRWESGTYSDLLDRASKHDQSDYDNLRTRFGTRPLNELAAHSPDWERIDELLEHDMPVPDDESFLQKTLQAGRRDLAVRCLEDMESIKADTAYELVLYDDELFDVLQETYTFNDSTALRAVNHIITRSTHQGFLPDKPTRIERLKRFHRAEQPDYNADIRGKGELSMRPLKTLAGFAHRSKDQQRTLSRRAELGDSERARLMETLVTLGADPNRPEVMAEALFVGTPEDVRMLFNLGFNAVDRLQESAFINAGDKQLRALVEQADCDMGELDAFRAGLSEKIQNRDWGSEAMVEKLFDEDFQALREPFFDAAINVPDDGLLALLIGRLIRRTHRPPPQSLVNTIKDGAIREAIDDNLTERQRRSFEQRHEKTQLQD